MKSSSDKKISLEAQLSILLFFLIVVIISTLSFINYFIGNILLSALFTAALVLPTSLISLHFFMTPINRTLSSLYHGFSNFLDNDFSISLAKTRNDELGELVVMYNRVGTALRNERVHLYQRELLLDTVMQTTPLCLILTESSNTIIYSNSAARKLFHKGKAINGYNFESLLEKLPTPFKRSLDSGLNGLFTVVEKNASETYHLTQNKFLLNGKQHQLYLFKRLTKEINRQEVNTWKKVIRLISHELNNSLAPISSLAHSGQLLCERLVDEEPDQSKLKDIFEIMEERSTYLQNFIEGYAEFARLPKPVIQKINIYTFLSNLQHLHTFNLQCHDENTEIYCDPAQLQQVIINLVKNAYESGSDKNFIELRVKKSNQATEIQIVDKGNGMSETNVKNALLPFYSTKQKGTGLGLPLCREIIEAHGGKMLINNRKEKGLSVTVFLPHKL